MAAADVTTRIFSSDPGVEVVVLEATDAETYTSQKFNSVLGVQATLMEDAGSLSIPLSCDVSGSVVTINATGLSDLAVCLTLYGNPGN